MSIRADEQDPAIRRFRRRRLADRAFSVLVVAAVGVALAPLVAVIGSVAAQGAPAVTPAFLVSVARPVGEPGGGIGHALAGSALLVASALAVAGPLGVAAGLFLAGTRQDGLARVVRTSADVLTGVPSIVVGVFAYAVLVVPLRHFSGLAGTLALAVIMWPLITRATEEVVRMVPPELTEAGLALGARRWRVALRVVLPAAAPGVGAALIGAASRAAGETAPLMFTAFGSPFFALDPTQPVAAVPLVIFNYAVSPYDDWRQQAWGAALVLCVLVLAGNLVSRSLIARRGPR